MAAVDCCGFATIAKTPSGAPVVCRQHGRLLLPPFLAFVVSEGGGVNRRGSFADWVVLTTLAFGMFLVERLSFVDVSFFLKLSGEEFDGWMGFFGGSKLLTVVFVLL